MRFTQIGQWTTCPPAAVEVAGGALTACEREILVLIARGRSSGEIVQELHLSDGTVRTHVGRIFTELQLRDRVQAVILGYECGLVPRGPG
ncbi:DNA-binding NarL/FixJ family response regulator [Streptosporangium album]|uniref:DNA-binding NarL/FixJ family response regulator n=1 Tax=Streptosporangium album TaxID=47479 RepID=A0A7W7RWB1_9ACTN|nr:helix-turn-helix transcriptional regulator [Streptosporangium album]MBB4939409.1 DNA-binding NarL/FixJ family response regulator [Streptosporangium album]